MSVIAIGWSVSEKDYDRILAHGTSVPYCGDLRVHDRVRIVSPDRSCTMVISDITIYDGIIQYFNAIGWQNIIPYATSEQDALHTIIARAGSGATRRMEHLHLVHTDDV